MTCRTLIGFGNPQCGPSVFERAFVGTSEARRAAWDEITYHTRKATERIEDQQGTIAGLEAQLGEFARKNVRLRAQRDYYRAGLKRTRKEKTHYRAAHNKLWFNLLRVRKEFARLLASRLYGVTDEF